MSSRHADISNRPRRLPKKGTLFGCARVASWLFIIFGLLLLAIALIGFIIMLLKTGPTLLDSLQYAGQQRFAGFVFLLSLLSLAIFPVVGLVGLIMIGIGFALGRIGTEPAAVAAVHVQEGQAGEPPKEGIG